MSADDRSVSQSDAAGDVTSGANEQPPRPTMIANEQVEVRADESVATPSVIITPLPATTPNVVVADAAAVRARTEHAIGSRAPLTLDGSSVWQMPSSSSEPSVPEEAQAERVDDYAPTGSQEVGRPV
jgi:hypothetical protein